MVIAVLDNTYRQSQVNMEETHNLETYDRKQPEGEYSISNKLSDIVKRLITPIYIYNTGRNIMANNWFTDVELVSDWVCNYKEKAGMSSVFGFIMMPT